MEKFIKKADILIEALPYIRAFRGKVTVIKYGGSAMWDESIINGILEDIVFMHCVGICPILVHGGGPLINQRLKEKGITPQFVEGIRKTDFDTMCVVDEVLYEINKKMVDSIRKLGGRVIGVHGRRDSMIEVRKKMGAADLGYVGEVISIKVLQFKKVLDSNTILVVSPVGVGKEGRVYNVNADEVASFIAVRMEAAKLVVLTDVKGIMRNKEDDKTLIPTLKVEEAQGLIKEGVINSGMMPKVNACIKALAKGVGKTHIIDYRIPHALLLEIFTDRGIGTEIVK